MSVSITIIISYYIMSSGATARLVGVRRDPTPPSMIGALLRGIQSELISLLTSGQLCRDRPSASKCLDPCQCSTVFQKGCRARAQRMILAPPPVMCCREVRALWSVTSEKGAPSRYAWKCRTVSTAARHSFSDTFP